MHVVRACVHRSRADVSSLNRDKRRSLTVMQPMVHCNKRQLGIHSGTPGYTLAERGSYWCWGGGGGFRARVRRL